MIPPNLISFIVYFHVPVHPIFLMIELLLLDHTAQRLHHLLGSSNFFTSHSSAVELFAAELALDTAFIIMSQNQSMSHTIAGTKQSPTNSLIVKLSSLSPEPPNRFVGTTKRNVNNGENIAYIQSLIARRKRMATSANVRSQNKRNMIAAMID